MGCIKSKRKPIFLDDEVNELSSSGDDEYFVITGQPLFTHPEITCIPKLRSKTS